MLITIISLIVILILAAVIYLATLDGNYTVRQSHTINADKEAVFDKLIDLKSWPEWSPWLIHEPDTRLEYSEKTNAEGGNYSWDGKYIGAGKLTHIKLERPNHIKNKLEFIRPFKSVCDVGFELEDEQGKTKVTWYMNGSMPFFFRFMVPRTVNLISNDYALGLAMLGGIMDSASEHPRLGFDGEIELQQQYSLFKHFEGLLPEMQKAMQAGFPELLQHVQAQGKQPSAPPFSVYHKVDLKKMHFVCDMAIPLSEDIEVGPFNSRIYEGGRFFKVTLKGDYSFLELAWHSAYTHVCTRKIKIDKKRPSLEIYENDPNQLENTNELITSLYIPVK
ncbi:MAG: GyrI-like domain-containing protein [Proteobacteria bacterium]|nr:GyrI-like domain-containing protein [Pseudomonadota bacterium]